MLRFRTDGTAYRAPFLIRRIEALAVRAATVFIRARRSARRKLGTCFPVIALRRSEHGVEEGCEGRPWPPSPTEQVLGGLTSCRTGIKLDSGPQGCFPDWEAESTPLGFQNPSDLNRVMPAQEAARRLYLELLDPARPALLSPTSGDQICQF